MYIQKILTDKPETVHDRTMIHLLSIGQGLRVLVGSLVGHALPGNFETVSLMASDGQRQLVNDVVGH